MICFDTDAAVAHFQLKPNSNILHHRMRVRDFVSRVDSPLMFPSVALAEYLFPFDGDEHAAEFAEILRRNVFVPEFDSLTAGIAAKLARSFAGGRKLVEVARGYDTTRVCLKADLQIVATALQHRAEYLVSNDPLVIDLGKHAQLPTQLLSALPDPLPPSPPPPPAKPGRFRDLFDDVPPTG